MITLDTLRKKPEYIDSNGDLSIDLSAGVWQFSGQIDIINMAVVTQETEMRLDLVSKVIYGDSNKVDYLMKFNGISNPFSIYAGQVIIAGDPGQLSNSIGQIQTGVDIEGNRADIRSTLFDPAKLTKKDQKRLEYIKKKSEGQTNLPPNFAEPGTNEITIKEGKVIFGDNVVVTKTDCAEPLSRAKVKARLLENKIFKLKV